jgi:ABC-type multidrug transport system fused ATPase/permease subunit
MFVGLMTLNGIVDSFGIALFLPLIELSLPGEEEISELSQTILGLIGRTGFAPTLTSVLVVMCLLFVLKGIVLFCGQILALIIRVNLEENQRAKLARSIHHAEYNYVMSRKVSDFNAIFDTEIQGVVHNLQALTQLLGALGTVAIYTIAAFWVDPVVGGISIAFGIFLGLAISRITRRIEGYSREVTAANLAVESQFLDYLQAFKYLKATETAGPILRLIEGILNRRRSLFISMHALRTIVNSTLEPMAIVIVGVFIYFLVEVQGQTVAPIILSLAYLYRSLVRVGVMHQSWQSFATSVGSIEAFQKSFNELESVQEQPEALPNPILKDGIAARDIRIDLGGRRILDDVSFEVARGTMVGLVGETGAGKSTLADVIAGLRRPDAGKVERGGIDYQELNLAELRQRNGYVTQEPVLFHGTVAANVTLWHEDPAPQDEASPKLIAALKSAQALDFVSEMPDGVTTVVGSRGHRLSGGQIQRLAIAREFYRDSDFLIFDEATSALDAETDHLVIQALRHFANTHAVLLISHRMVNLRTCDRIDVMNRGRIVQSGQWAELIADEDGWFMRSLDLQNSKSDSSA